MVYNDSMKRPAIRKITRTPTAAPAMVNDHLAGEQFESKNKPRPSAELVDIARKICSNKVLLGISGKDSLAAWLWLRELGFDITPYAMYGAPGLSHFTEIMAYYEDFFNTTIIRLPAPQFWDNLNKLRFQTPDRVGAIRGLNVEKYRNDGELESWLAKSLGLPDNYLGVSGYRAGDGIGRRSFIINRGPLGVKTRRYWFAIWDWKVKDVFAIIEKYGAKLSREYAHFGCTGDIYLPSDLAVRAFDIREDYEKIKEWFPLIPVQVLRWYYVE